MPDDEIDDTTGDDTGAGTEVDDGADDDTGASTGDDAGGKSKGREPKIEGDFDADRAKRLIDRLRANEKAEKDKARAAEQKAADTLKKVAVALGLSEDDKPDADALARQLEEARSQERQRRTENLVLRLAPGLGADPDVLLDSTAFLKAIAEHGPDDRDVVTDTIRDFLAKSTRFALPSAKTADADSDTSKTTSKTTEKKAAGRSGTDMNGAGGQARQVTAAELAKMTPQQIVAAQEKGLLRDLLGA